MENIIFSQEGKITFYLSFAVGTLLLVGFLLTKNESIFVFGFYYVLIAAVINAIVFLYELTVFISNISDHRHHGNSAALLLLNIPVSIIYFLAVINA